jgi:glycosyltransferase involved in cell wall biosynthesis
VACDISVVIATFRRPELLAKAIRSALEQEGVSLEVVVVDDSPEGSAEAVVKGIGDERVHYTKMETPSGGWPGRVRNAGWPKATGRLVHFLDDDDTLEPGHYRAMKAAFDRSPDLGVVFSRLEPFGDAKAMEHERPYFRRAGDLAAKCERFGTRLAYVSRILFEPTIIVCGVSTIRRDCLERAGGFDPAIKVGEDIELLLRIIREHGTVFVDRVAIHYRVSGTSMAHSDRAEADVRETYKHMHRRYKERYGALEFFALKVLAKSAFKVI